MVFKISIEFLELGRLLADGTRLFLGMPVCDATSTGYNFAAGALFNVPGHHFADSANEFSLDFALVGDLIWVELNLNYLIFNLIFG